MIWSGLMPALGEGRRIGRGRVPRVGLLCAVAVSAWLLVALSHAEPTPGVIDPGAVGVDISMLEDGPGRPLALDGSPRLA